MKKDLMPLSTFTDPMRDFRKLFNNGIDSLFDNFMPSSYMRNDFFSPKVNLSETDSNYELTAELPGMTKDEVKVDISNNTLTLKGHKKNEEKKEGKHFYRIESSYGEFYREFSLPKSVEHEKIHASFKNGVLIVTIPKKKNDSNSKNIEIKEDK